MTLVFLNSKLVDQLKNFKMEQIKLEIQKLYKALDKLETRCDKIKNLKVDQNAEDNSDIKKEFLNLRNKVTRLIDEFK